jgi:hypothetical protein
MNIERDLVSIKKHFFAFITFRNNPKRMATTGGKYYQKKDSKCIYLHSIAIVTAILNECQRLIIPQ